MAEMVSFSSRVVPPSVSFITSYGIIGLYISVVLVVGRFLRMAVSNMSQRIIYENMPQVQTLTNVCSLVYLARQLDPPHLALEEDLYHLLVEIYRSPEAIIAWTDEALLEPDEQAP